MKSGCWLVCLALASWQVSAQAPPPENNRLPEGAVPKPVGSETPARPSPEQYFQAVFGNVKGFRVDAAAEIEPTNGGCSMGFPGVPGSNGMPGRNGRNGEPGPQGETGPRGERGEQGLIGVPGPVGLIGAPGVVGEPGIPGAPGTPGSMGPAGPMGAPGYIGLKGDMGDPGRPGDRGARGLPGAVGPSGSPGRTGVPGLNGLSGRDGRPGRTGRDGRTLWKQCAWTETNDLDTGVLKTCSFNKTMDDTYLKVSFSGNLRLGGCSYCCRRWFFTFNGTECSSPVPIDGTIFLVGPDSANPLRPRHIEGYCGQIGQGPVSVEFNVGNCADFGESDAYLGYGSSSRIVIEEVHPPQE